METYRVRFSNKNQRHPRFEEFLDELLDRGIFWQTKKVDCTSEILLHEATEVIRIAGNFELTGEIIPA